MNQLIRHTLTSLFIAVLSFTAAAHAQSSTWIIKVHVPFEFVTGDQTFPAGDYSLAQPLQHLLELRDSRGQVIASVLTHGIQSSTVPTQAKLKFYSSGGRHVLAEVWQGQEAVGYQFPRPKPEVTLARQSSGDDPDTSGGFRP